MTSRANARVDQRIDDWKLKLIDLTRRNKLINYKETKTSSLKITSLKIDTIFNRARSGENFPWIGCIETNFSPETRANWIHLLDTISSTLETLIQDSNTYTQALKLTTPHTIHDYENLQTLSNIISQTPRPPGKWFTDINLEEVQA